MTNTVSIYDECETFGWISSSSLSGILHLDMSRYCLNESVNFLASVVYTNNNDKHKSISDRSYLFLSQVDQITGRQNVKDNIVVGCYSNMTTIRTMGGQSSSNKDRIIIGDWCKNSTQIFVSKDTIVWNQASDQTHQYIIDDIQGQIVLRILGSQNTNQSHHIFFKEKLDHLDVNVTIVTQSNNLTLFQYKVDINAASNHGSYVLTSNQRRIIHNFGDEAKLSFEANVSYVTMIKLSSLNCRFEAFQHLLNTDIIFMAMTSPEQPQEILLMSGQSGKLSISYALFHHSAMNDDVIV